MEPQLGEGAAPPTGCASGWGEVLWVPRKRDEGDVRPAVSRRGRCSVALETASERKFWGHFLATESYKLLKIQRAYISFTYDAKKDSPRYRDILRDAPLIYIIFISVSVSVRKVEFLRVWASYGHLRFWSGRKLEQVREVFRFGTIDRLQPQGRRSRMATTEEQILGTIGLLALIGGGGATGRNEGRGQRNCH